MDLNQKFEGITCNTTVYVSEINVNRKYRILRAQRLTTRFGPAVILTVKGEDAAPVQMFLPRRYSDVFTDTDIEQINSKAVCPASRLQERMSHNKSLFVGNIRCHAYVFITGSPVDMRSDSQ
jgi:hypothetical protein